MNDRKRATAAFIDIDALLQDTWLMMSGVCSEN